MHFLEYKIWNLELILDLGFWILDWPGLRLSLGKLVDQRPGLYDLVICIKGCSAGITEIPIPVVGFLIFQIKAAYGTVQGIFHNQGSPCAIFSAVIFTPTTVDLARTLPYF